jgi:hypothetical protein
MRAFVYPLPDEVAHTVGEAAMGLGRAALALPLDALQAWLITERSTLLAGRPGVTGADPRQVDQLLLIAARLESLANCILGFDEIMDEIEQERAAATVAAAAPAEPEPTPAPKPVIPDDWTT